MIFNTTSYVILTVLAIPPPLSYCRHWDSLIVHLANRWLRVDLLSLKLLHLLGSLISKRIRLPLLKFEWHPVIRIIQLWRRLRINLNSVASLSRWLLVRLQVHWLLQVGRSLPLTFHFPFLYDTPRWLCEFFFLLLSVVLNSKLALANGSQKLRRKLLDHNFILLCG